MKKTILLAVDTTGHTAAAANMARDLAAGTGDRIVVMHEHEFAVGRFGRIQVDCGEGEGEHVAAEMVDRLTAAGIDAAADIREAPVGRIARTISDAADELDVRVIIVGSSSTHDVPRLRLAAAAAPVDQAGSARPKGSGSSQRAPNCATDERDCRRRELGWPPPRARVAAVPIRPTWKHA
jgi:nucleotide-binding universal stress UspA family protein